MADIVDVTFTVDDEYEEDVFDTCFALCCTPLKVADTWTFTVMGLDATLVESLGPDELAEFFGLQSESVIAIEVEDA